METVSIIQLLTCFSVGCDDSSFSLAISMETVEDCSSFLWNEPGKHVMNNVTFNDITSS